MLPWYVKSWLQNSHRFYKVIRRGNKIHYTLSNIRMKTITMINTLYKLQLSFPACSLTLCDSLYIDIVTYLYLFHCRMSVVLWVYATFSVCWMWLTGSTCRESICSLPWMSWRERETIPMNIWSHSSPSLISNWSLCQLLWWMVDPRLITG